MAVTAAVLTQLRDLPEAPGCVALTQWNLTGNLRLNTMMMCEQKVDLLTQRVKFVKWYVKYNLVSLGEGMVQTGRCAGAQPHVRANVGRRLTEVERAVRVGAQLGHDDRATRRQLIAQMWC